MKIKASELLRLGGLSHDYRTLFTSPVGQKVLADLARTCHAADTTWHEDAREQALREGKRQVFLHIRAMLKLSPDDIEKLMKGNE